jgi:hypothetical protein
MNKRLSIITVAVTGLILLGSLFYWYQVRPASIKHDCSWVMVHEDMKSAVTQAEIDAETKKREIDCANSKDSWERLNFCSLIKGITSQEPHDAVPIKDYYRKASEDEYKFCLHDKGL